MEEKKFAESLYMFMVEIPFSLWFTKTRLIKFYTINYLLVDKYISKRRSNFNIILL